jgi:DNA-binding transcriptional regulator PaaX
MFESVTKQRQSTRQALSALLSSLADGGALLEGIKGSSAEQIISAHSLVQDQALSHALYLQQKELIVINELDDSMVSLTLTLAGWRRVQRYRVQKLAIKQPSHWDHRWRIVMFDIPERFKTSRNAVTIELKKLGFFQLQRSVWVHPFECQSEVGMLSQLYGVDQFMVYMNVEYTNAHATIHNHFISLLGRPERTV